MKWWKKYLNKLIVTDQEIVQEANNILKNELKLIANERRQLTCERSIFSETDTERNLSSYTMVKWTKNSLTTDRQHYLTLTFDDWPDILIPIEYDERMIPGLVLLYHESNGKEIVLFDYEIGILSLRDSVLFDMVSEPRLRGYS